MYTSVVFFSLAGFVVASHEAVSSVSAPAWQSSYSLAMDQGQKLKKPLAIFVGTGKNGYENVTRDGSLSPAVRKILAQEFVSVYLDHADPKNQGVISNLGLAKDAGLVISDRSGSFMAVHHQGTVEPTQLLAYLQEYSNPDVWVRETKSNAVARNSFYPVQEQRPAGYYQPQRYIAPPSFIPARSFGPAVNC